MENSKKIIEMKLWNKDKRNHIYFIDIILLELKIYLNSKYIKHFLFFLFSF